MEAFFFAFINLYEHNGNTILPKLYIQDLLQKILEFILFPICYSSIAYQYEANNISWVPRMYRYSTVTFAYYLCHCMPDDKGELYL